jgi:hypothetical protein
MALRLVDPLLGLSTMADLGFGLPPGEALRSCALATSFARRLDLPEPEVRTVYYTALLQHLGCTGFAHETAQVTSADQTRIAYRSTGAGTPLVVVHGTTADHTRWRPVLPLLAGSSLVHAVDRRGRGGSGDHPEYAIEREFEDIAAVVRAVRGAGRVDLLGHSYGACARSAPPGWPAPRSAAWCSTSRRRQRRAGN